MNRSQISEKIWSTLLGILIGFGIVTVLMISSGYNPLDAYIGIFSGALGNVYRFTEILIKMTPLLLAGLGAIIAFKSGVWNIGLEGQICMGAAATAWSALSLPSMPALILLPLLVGIGFFGGACWGLIAGVLKAKFNTNEIFVTLMLNFIAILFITFLVTGPMREPTAIFSRSAEIPLSAQLPILIPNTRLHAGLLVALISAVLVYVLMQKTAFGYELRIIGTNIKAARFAGININQSIIIAMFLSGGLAGLAGMSEVSGVHRYLLEGISSEYGYIAILVALLGGLHSFAIVASAFLFSALMVGAPSMQRTAGVPVPLVDITLSLIILMVIAIDILARKRRRRIDTGRHT